MFSTIWGWLYASDYEGSVEQNGNVESEEAVLVDDHDHDHDQNGDGGAEAKTKHARLLGEVHGELKDGTRGDREDCPLLEDTACGKGRDENAEEHAEEYRRFYKAPKQSGKGTLRRWLRGQWVWWTNALGLNCSGAR